MRANGMRGEVLVDFIVDREGRVRNAFVARSLNPSSTMRRWMRSRRWRLNRPGTASVRSAHTCRCP